MIVYIILGLMLIVGISMWIIQGSYYDRGPILTIIAAVLLAIFALCHSLEYYSQVSNIEAFKQVKKSIEVAREQGDITEYERAALQNKIIDWNSWLVRKQYWNNSMWDMFIPDEVMNLEPLK